MHPLYRADVFLFCAHLALSSPAALSSSSDVPDSSFLNDAHPLRGVEIAGIVTYVTLRGHGRDARALFLVDDGSAGVAQASVWLGGRSGVRTPRVGDAVIVTGLIRWDFSVASVASARVREVRASTVRVLGGDDGGLCTLTAWASRALRLHETVYSRSITEMMPTCAALPRGLAAAVVTARDDAGAFARVVFAIHDALLRSHPLARDSEVARAAEGALVRKRARSLAVLREVAAKRAAVVGVSGADDVATDSGTMSDAATELEEWEARHSSAGAVSGGEGDGVAPADGVTRVCAESASARVPAAAQEESTIAATLCSGGWVVATAGADAEAVDTGADAVCAYAGPAASDTESFAFAEFFTVEDVLSHLSVDDPEAAADAISLGGDGQRAVRDALERLIADGVCYALPAVNADGVARYGLVTFAALLAPATLTVLRDGNVYWDGMTRGVTGATADALTESELVRRIRLLQPGLKATPLAVLRASWVRLEEDGLLLRPGASLFALSTA